jgi:hypothetical protein
MYPLVTDGFNEKLFFNWLLGPSTTLFINKKNDEYILSFDPYHNKIKYQKIDWFPNICIYEVVFINNLKKLYIKNVEDPNDCFFTPKLNIVLGKFFPLIMDEEYCAA